MRAAADQFGPITIDPLKRVPEGERKRKFPRVKANVQARLLPHSDDSDDTFRQGRVTNICETGCLLTVPWAWRWRPCRSGFSTYPNTDVAIRGRVKHSGPAAWVSNFREIRKSDRRFCVIGCSATSRSACRRIGGRCFLSFSLAQRRLIRQPILMCAIRNQGAL